MLFATLDPTLRALRLPHGARIMLSDTVGFISDLPTMLVTAFRATLEEVIEADVILHVRDISHEDTEAQSADVATILAELGIPPEDHGRIIEVWNKVDLLDPAGQERILNAASRRPVEGRPQVVSAITGAGTDTLLAAIEDRLATGHRRFRVSLFASDGEGLAWLYEHAEVLERGADEEGTQSLLVRVPPDRMERLRRRFPEAVQDEGRTEAEPAP